MTSDLVLLVVLYAAVALMACWLAAVSRMPVLLKLVAIVLIGASDFVCWQLWRDATGWPTEEPMPKNFLFHAATIEEPDEHSGSKGSLLLWLTTLKNDGPDGPPRSYRVPYKRSLHEQVQLAMDRMREGHPQIGSIKENDNGESGRGRGMFSIEEPPPDFELRTLPAPALPEK